MLSLSALQEAPYQIRLSVFEGPLDLLLQLIERDKLDISTVSLAQVTDQFLAYVKELEDVQADTLADFSVVAARLIWIKSRSLLPQPPKPDEEQEEDPGEALARQLREYKRFKEVATRLAEIEALGLHTYPRAGPLPELERHLEGSGVTLDDLLAAFHRALAPLPPTPLPSGVVTPFTLTISDQIHLIRRSTEGGQPVKFHELLHQARHRLEIIVTLLAILELLKRRQISVSQDALFGEIIISPVAGAPIGEGEGENSE